MPAPTDLIDPRAPARDLTVAVEAAADAVNVARDVLADMKAGRTYRPDQIRIVALLVIDLARLIAALAELAEHPR